MCFVFSCASTYASCLQVRDALDVEIVKESWTQCMQSLENLVFPWSNGLQKMAIAYFPHGLAKRPQ